MIEAEHAGPPAAPPPPDRRHEPGDENYRTILITGGALTVGTVIICVLMWWLLLAFQRRESEEKQGLFPLAVEENQLPIDQRLQQISRSHPLLEGLKRQEGEATDVRPRQLQPSEQNRLQTYGPTEPPEKGYVRVPIDVAMRRMLEKERFPVQKGQRP